ncbi:MAG: PorT family protein [Fibromonadaceae bacterium]|nr:PorT family protein [Fibromonadaceae bacterium]
MNRILGLNSLSKLVNTVGSDYEDYKVSDETMILFLSEVKNLSVGECIVDEPYKPPSNRKQLDKIQPSLLSLDLPSWLYLGFRSGINFSQICDDDDSYYEDCSGNILGMQLGIVLNIAMSERFYIQSGLMYIQKGMDAWHSKDLPKETLHYLELPLLVSLKFSAFRLNVGPYFGLCILGNSDYEAGFNAGIGFDIGMFYIGAFYDYGISRQYLNYSTFGLNVGVNL